MIPDQPPASLLATVFGPAADDAVRFAELLVEHGVTRGLIGPREVERLWQRHILNSAVVGEHIPHGARVLDVGSGAGLPGIPLALARPDLDLILLEPMARRIAWLTEAVDALDLPVRVVRGRAEEASVREDIGEVDVVTARAVAPLAKLAGWCLPLLRPGGTLVALKGDSAAEEVARDSADITRLGGGTPVVRPCGVGVLADPTTVVTVERIRSATRPTARGAVPRSRRPR